MLEVFPDLTDQAREHIRHGEFAHELIGRHPVLPGLHARVNMISEWINSVASDNYTNKPSITHLVSQLTLSEQRDEAYYGKVGEIWTDRRGVLLTSSLLESLLSKHPLDRAIPSVMSDHEKKVYSNLSDTLIVFRGHSPFLRDGMSWTLDFPIALRWALGFATNGYMTMGSVQRKHVLAYIDRWKENEILVNPSLVDCKTTFLVREEILKAMEGA